MGALFAIFPFQPGFRDKGNTLSCKDTFNKELKKLISPIKCKCGRDPCECTFSATEQRRNNFVRYLEREGIPYKLITMHSWRKGSASFAASGSTAAPSIITICLRAAEFLRGLRQRGVSRHQAQEPSVVGLSTLLNACRTLLPAVTCRDLVPCRYPP